jgi:hypothetical protein
MAEKYQFYRETLAALRKGDAISTPDLKGLQRALEEVDNALAPFPEADAVSFFLRHYAHTASDYLRARGCKELERDRDYSIEEVREIRAAWKKAETEWNLPSKQLLGALEIAAERAERFIETRALGVYFTQVRSALAQRGVQ